MQGMERPLEMSGTGEHQFLRRRNLFEIVLRPVEVGLVGIGVPARAGVGGHFDLREQFSASWTTVSLSYGIDKQIEIGWHMLALLGQHVVDMRIHLIVGIGHGLAPDRFLLWRQRTRLALRA